jgi:23S rRNA (adenine2503-C2)-methyltransferase
MPAPPTFPIDLLGTPREALADHLHGLGIPRHHAARVFRGVHRDRLPLDAIPDLGRYADILAPHVRTEPVAIATRKPSADGSTRLVFRLADGAMVEGVLLPNKDHARATLCVSSQVGCAMACAFCATGTLGLSRDLTAGEIVGQVRAAQEELVGSGRRLTRLVFMGMGEPLHAYDSVRDALRVLLDDHGTPLAARNITVSTVGLVRRLAQLGEDFGGRLQLALSLHAGTDATRRRIVPTARTTPLHELRAALAQLPRSGRRPLMLEYVLLPGVNDAEEEWDGVAAFIGDLPAVLNLIPFNPFPGAPFRSPSDDEIERAWRALRARGIRNSVRWPRGRAAQAACGQLMLDGAV